MKKIASIAAIAVFAVAFTSCKKDYTCECVLSIDGEEISRQTTELKDMKKKDAKSQCKDVNASTMGVNMTANCNLK